MSKHLRFCCYTCGGHAQKVMEKIGITYSHSTPQSMYNQWWFWNCKNVPEILPEYLKELKMDPFEAVGYGLNEEIAREIKNG